MKHDLIQFNKFAYLHNGKNIHFCKIDYLEKLFNDLRKINNEVLIITGNSDFGIYNFGNKIIIKDLGNYILTEFEIDHMPKNVKYWFSSNNLTDLQFIKTLPMGLENDIECILPGHGVGWNHAKEKIEILSDHFGNCEFSKIDNLIYLNCNVSTNFEYRNKIKNHCFSKNIEIEKEKLSYSNFVEKCKKFKGVICPSGNGIDTHRFYEILLLNRIPILIKYDDLKIYDNFFKNFPCIILDNLDELDVHKLNDQLDDKLKSLDNSKLMFSYWANYIQSYLN